MRVWAFSLHGLFLWWSYLETIQMSRSFILQFIHSFPFVWWKKRGTGPYCISWPIVSKEYPDKQVGALMWALRGPHSPNLRLPGPFFNKALTLAERPQSSVSLVRWEPSGMLMNVQCGFVSCTVLPLSTSSSLSSPLKLRGCFTGLLLQGRHLAHCDANSLKFDVWGLFFQVRMGLWDWVFWQSTSTFFVITEKPAVTGCPPCP